MALPDWILGVLLRPGQTFLHARDQMRGAYWWILLSVFTVESVLVLYSPAVSRMLPRPSADLLLFNLLTLQLAIFWTQAICLLGVGFFFGWRITFGEAMKYTGLTWALYLLEDLVTFYPYLKEQYTLLFWVSIAFALWRMAALAAGVRQLSGFPAGRAILTALLATLPWQVPLLITSWPG